MTELSTTQTVESASFEEINSNTLWRIGKKNKPQLTSEGKNFLESLYYEKIFPNEKPVSRTSEIRSELNKFEPRLGFNNLVKKYLEEKLTTNKVERKTAETLLDGSSVWSDAFQNAYPDSQDLSSAGKFSVIVLDAQEKIENTVNQRVGVGEIPKEYQEENVRYMQTSAAQELANSIKEQKSENVPGLAEKALEKIIKQLPLTDNDIKNIKAESITLPEKRSLKTKFEEFTNKIRDLFPKKVRQRVVLSALTLTVGTASVSFPQVDTVKGTVGAAPKTVQVEPDFHEEVQKPQEQSPVARIPQGAETPPPTTPEYKTEEELSAYPGLEESQFPGSFNRAGKSIDEVTKTTGELMRTFLKDGYETTAYNPENRDLNRAWEQIAGPLPENLSSLKDRGVGSEFSEGKWGFGFKEGNYTTTNNPEENKEKELYKIEGKFARGMGITTYDKIKESTFAMIQALYKQTGENISDPQIQKEINERVSSILNSKVYFGPNGEIISNQVLMESRKNGHQKETVSKVTAMGGLQIPGDGIDQEDKNNVDSKTSVVQTVLVVLDENGKIKSIHVEFFSAASSGIDDLNPEMGTEYRTSKGKVRNGMRRFVKVTQEVIESIKTIPGRQTETPPVEPPGNEEEELKPGWGGPQGGHYGPPGHGYTPENPGKKNIPPGKTDPKNPGKGKGKNK